MPDIAMTEGEAYLDVTNSLTGRLWRGPSIQSERIGLAIAQQTGLPGLLSRVLAARGVTPEGALDYLEPTLKRILPDPATIEDMQKAAERFARAVIAGEYIAIFADYDVDGAASAASLIEWLRAVGHDATLYVPDRLAEGYGPNKPAMAKLAKDHSLIVCVDCGTLAHEAIASANEKGADVIVLDHHLPGEQPSPAFAFVNPNRTSASTDLNILCAAGVVFLFLVALNRHLRQEDFFDGQRPEPDLRDWLDLTGLATVADMSPLQGINRAFVRQGLKLMRKRKRLGLRELADCAGLSGATNAGHLGFALAPRINAGGRIGDGSLAVQLLIERDSRQAKRLAVQLDQLNAERRNLEKEAFAAARAQIEARSLAEDAPLIWAASDKWHPGVLGIVAGRLKECFMRPAIALNITGNMISGSGRSVEKVNLGHAIAQCLDEGLLLKGGGHEMAAGLSLQADMLDRAMDFLGERLRRLGAGKATKQTVTIDAPISPSAATEELCCLLEQAGPWGIGAPAPRFAFPNAHIVWRKEVGNSHLRLKLVDDFGASLAAIAFRAFDRPIGTALMQNDRVHLVGRVELNEWNGRRSVQMLVEDAACSGAPAKG